MATCRRCGNEVGGISSLFTFNQRTGRCKSCEAAVQQALIRFRETFLRITADGIFTVEKSQYLAKVIASDRIEMQEALAFIRADALSFLDRTLDTVTSQGPLTDKAEEYIRHLRRLLAVPDNAASHLLRRLTLLNIYRGKFPIIPHSFLQDLRLESDETCYLLTGAQYYKINTASTKLVQGRLLATNKKLRFLSPTGGTDIAWNSIMGIRKQWSPAGQIPVLGIYLELNKKSGNGFYAVSDPEIVIAIVDTLVRISKRQLVKAESENNRHIPQDVKSAVWQRDQGKCVQCGATDYLEYDHIIPHSKGGASTVNNVQLLCRRCNQVKSDRI